MAPRANWRGFVVVGELSCPVGLYTAVSTAERVHFHTIDRKTGNRVQRQFIDRETGAVVEHDDQVKGYEIAPNDYVVLEPDEIAAAVPDSDKALKVESFIPCSTVDEVYFDRPYYLAPGSAAAIETYRLIRDGMRERNVAALARTVLFRRVRTLLVRPDRDGLIATTLKFDYEIRPAEAAFREIPQRKIGGEMLDLARHIIETKRGSFDPTQFEDRYEAALAQLIEAKRAGKPLKPAKPRAPAKVTDLMDALRRSAAPQGKTTSPVAAAGRARKRAG